MTQLDRRSVSKQEMMNSNKKKVRTMDETTTCTTTVVDRSVLLLSCALCGPVGVYLCGSDVAVLHHIEVAHNQENS